jgi:hypothetical protein
MVCRGRLSIFTDADAGTPVVIAGGIVLVDDLVGFAELLAGV